MGTEFGVRIGVPLGSGRDGPPLPEFEIDSDSTLIEFETERGVGHAKCVIGGIAHYRDSDGALVAEPAYLPQRAAWAQPFYDVAVYAGTTEIYRGFMTKSRRDVYGRIVGFECAGYRQILRRRFFHDLSTTEATAGEIARRYIENHAPFLRVGNAEQFIDSMAQVTPADVSGMNGLQIIEHLASIGDTSGNLWDIEVWGRTVWARPRIPPSQPVYNPPLDGRNDEPDEDWSQLRSRLRLRYRTPIDTNGLTDWFSDDDFPEQYGDHVEDELPGGVITANVADQLALTALRQFNRPRFAFRFNRSRSEGLERVDGGVTPQHLVRSNEWGRVLNLGTFSVARTHCNVTTGDASFDVGDHRRDFDQMLRSYNHFASRVRTRINPVTNAKEYVDFAT